jgi:hypothetical protein
VRRLSRLKEVPGEGRFHSHDASGAGGNPGPRLLVTGPEAIIFRHIDAILGIVAVGAVLLLAEPEDCDEELRVLLGCLTLLVLLAIPRVCRLFRAVR